MPQMMVATLLSLLLLLPLTACGGGKLPPPGTPVEGKILDSGTKQPIPGAIVVVRWQGSYSQLVETKTVCYHVETATTDAEGKYRTPAWTPEDLGPNFTPGPQLIDAYKAGYERDWPPGFDRSEEFRKNIYFLKTFKGATWERLRYLERTLDATRCGSQNESENNLHAMYYAMYEEAKNMVVSKDDAEIVDTLRYWAFFVLLDKNKPMTRDEKGRLINVESKSK